DVLKVISSSPGELEPVFNAMLENATRICDAEFGTLYLREADAFRAVAIHNAPPAYVQARKRALVRPPPDSALGQVVTTHQVAQIDDITKTKSYIERDPYIISAVELGGYRTIAAVPMLKDDELVGAILIYRQEVRSFSEKQIALLRNFADQAVIAIENTRLLSELRQRTGALSESLDRQTAMSEVLGVISSSPTDLTPVFDTILANATRLCEGNLAALWRYDGEFLVGAAQYNASAAFVEHYMGTKLEPGRSGPARLAALECRTVHVADITAEPGFSPMVLQYERARTVLAVPLLREKDLVGVIAIWRREVRPFTEQQIALVRTFADQAVIAIENARLLNELRESLQQQTATADVLKVISSSPGELEPVFQAILENATHICGAKFGVLWLSKDGGFLVAATHSIPAAYREQLQAGVVFHPGPSLPIARAASTRQAVHIADLRTDPGYLDGEPVAKGGVELGQVRTLLAMPMLKDRDVVGAFAIYRQEVQPFTDKQIELVKNFAAQAVIAIENTRLLSELRKRTEDLSESLEQQTATSEVLQVISRSAGELQPVFDTMLENAVRICGAKFGNLLLVEGDAYRHVALYGAPQAFLEERRRNPVIRPRPGSDLDRVRTTKQIIHIADMQVGGAATSAIVELAGARTFLNVPMLKDDELIGTIGIYRQEVRPFTDKQIELVKNFAAQAVIAIENARLVSELRESLQQQTATADVLKVISRSTFNLRTVLQTLIESAARLCDADKGNITREKDGIFFRAAESYGYSPEFVEHVKGMPIEADRGSGTGRALLEKRVIHIPDVKADPEYTLLEGQRLGDYRTVLAVPMLREGIPLGVLTLTRSDVRPFTDKQIELVTTFADQAAIAIENVRLFDSVEARTRELAASLENLRTTQDRLVQTEKLASLGQLTAGIAHEIK
ncbi:MAG: GAF domain-containing protein, partial [Pseudolabrys sp.]